MSHTPLGRSEDPARDYALGWRATWRHVRSGKSWSGGERDCAFLNLGDGRFADVSSAIGFDSPGDGRALATTDWDGDGALDLWMTQRDGPRVVFYKNRRPGTHHWLALRLADAGANRNAIGARVDVVLESGVRLVREVAAGSGYLSQSSLELHFGLGSEARIAQVSVRWPGGERESFGGVEASGRFLLARGAGTGRALPPRSSAVEAREVALAAVRTAPTGRVEPVAPIPLAGLVWRGADGAERELGATKAGRHQLVKLITSTCASCAHVLRALSASKSALDAAGVDVLALALDDEARAADAFARLDSVRWPHARGRAERAFQDGLALFLEELLDRSGALVLPTGLLLDDAGQLVLLYRGAVDVPAITNDVERLRAAGGELPEPALPWPGRWIDPPTRERDLLALANRLASGGQPRLAETLLGRLSIAPAAAASLAPIDRRRVFEAFHELGHARAAAGDDRGAITAYERALSSDPESSMTMLALAGALRRVRELDRAEEHLDAARGRLPETHTGLLLELAFVHAARGRATQAEEAFSRVVALESSSGLAHLNLGLLRLARGAHEEALPALARAAELRANDPEARAQLGKALYLANRHAEAILEYQASLQLRAGHAETHYNLALAAARGGNQALAREQAGQLDTLDAALAARLRALLDRAPR